MPIYEYECTKCETWFDELIYSKDEEKKLKCPKCNSKKIERRFSTFSSHTKEPGKHANDPGLLKDKMAESAEKPMSGMEALNDHFH